MSCRSIFNSRAEIYLNVCKSKVLFFGFKGAEQLCTQKWIVFYVIDVFDVYKDNDAVRCVKLTSQIQFNEHSMMRLFYRPSDVRVDRPAKLLNLPQAHRCC